MFLWNLFGFLFASLFSVLGFFTDDSEPTSENLQLPSLPMTPIVPGQPLPWIEVVKSILFWSVLIGVIGFALHQYLQQNQGLWQAIKRFPLVSWLVNLFEGLRGWFSQSWRSMASGMGAVRDRLIPRRSARIAPETWHYIRLNSLSPRQQVLFFFQALVHKAEQRYPPR
jgi:hypothetical protein